MTEKPRFSITLDENLFDRLEKYRYEKKFSTRSKAAVHLIEIALDSLDGEPKNELPKDEKLVLDGYRKATYPVRRIILNAAEDAVKGASGKSSNSEGEAV